MSANFVVRLDVPELKNIACIVLEPVSHVAARVSADMSDPTGKRWFMSVRQQLSKLELGGHVVVFPVLDDPERPCMNVICHRSIAVKVFKAIAAHKEVLQARVSKESIILRLTPPLLDSAASNLISQMLQQAGWTVFPSNQYMRSRVLIQREGRVHACEVVTMLVSVQHPSSIILSLEPGVGRFRPFSVAEKLPEGACLPCESTSTADLAKFNAALWAMQTICTLLPDCRPALLAGIKPAVENEEQIREMWDMRTGWELPDRLPYFLDLRFSDDEDDPVITVPSCCVWSQSGLNVVPATYKNGNGITIVQQLADDLKRSSLQLWGMKDKVLFSFHSVHSNAAQPHAANSPWKTARDTEAEGQQPQCSIDAHLLPLEPPADINSHQRNVEPGPELLAVLEDLSVRGIPERQPGSQIPLGGKHHRPGRLNAMPMLKQHGGQQLTATAVTCSPQEEAHAAPLPGNISGNGPAGIAQQPGKAPAVPTSASRKKLGSSVPPGQAQKAAPAAKQHVCPAKRAAKAMQQSEAKRAGSWPLHPAKQPVSSVQPQVNEAAGLAEASQLLEHERGQQQALSKNALGATAAAAPEATAVPKAAPRNRVKAGDLDPAEIEAKVRQKHAENALEKLSIPEMKCFLKSKKLPVSGKKAELVARLMQSLGHSTTQ